MRTGTQPGPLTEEDVMPKSNAMVGGLGVDLRLKGNHQTRTGYVEDDSTVTRTDGLAVTMTGALTLTEAQQRSPHLLLDPGGADRVVTLRTGTQLEADTYLKLDGVGHVFVQRITNTADADEVISIAGGVGTTLDGGLRVLVGRYESVVLCYRRTAANTFRVSVLERVPLAAREEVTLTGAVNVSAANCLRGKIGHDPDSGDRTPTLPAAADLITAFGFSADGQFAEVQYRHAGSANTLTVGENTGTTIDNAGGDLILAAGEVAPIRFVRTGAAAVRAVVVKE